MSSKLVVAPYTTPVALRSALFKASGDGPIPPVDELEVLYSEISVKRQNCIAQGKKASEDLKTIEDSLRRMKEKVKGKERALDKIKRERGSATPMPDVDDARPLASKHAGMLKARPPLAHGTGPPSARSSVDPRKSATEEMKKKKKKRKRDIDDSDSDEGPSKHREVTPSYPPPHQPHPHPQPHPIKASKAPSSSQPSSKSSTVPDFSVPPATSLVVQRPEVPSPPIPGPSKPTGVMEDFSKAKQPSQALVTTFYASIEPWLRPIREEDLGFLAYSPDDVEPYVMPKRGRHYLDVWADEDIALYGHPLPGFAPPRDPDAPDHRPQWDPSTLSEQDLLSEDKGHAPLTEHVISALLPVPDVAQWKGVKAAEDAMEGRPGGYGAAMARREKVNVSDLEDRMKDNLRFHGLISSMPDYSERVDDPIATALRHCQSELRRVSATNRARKARLLARAQDRLGYQEYVDGRDALDRAIAVQYAKLQKKDVPRASKKKKAKHERDKDKDSKPNGHEAAVSGAPPCPAALGLGTDEGFNLGVPESLRQLVEYRKQWVALFARKEAEIEQERPGALHGLPKSSVFEGVEEEVERELARVEDPGGKGKARARGDAMDVS